MAANKSTNSFPWMMLVITSVWILVTVTADVRAAANESYLSGGFISFYFDDGHGVGNTSKAQVTVITSWVLGHGPCGQNCKDSDVGSSTHDSRLQQIQTTGNPFLFGNWSTEIEVKSVGWSPSSVKKEDITDIVNNNIDGRVAAISQTMNWEQEIAHTVIDIDTTKKYTDIILHGNKWRTFDLNQANTPFTSTSQGKIGSGFRLQTKVRASIRNDTRMPNSSPLVLYQPIYRVQLDSVTELRLSSSDKDGDLIECRLGEIVEVEGIGGMKGASVSKDCVVRISAMTTDGFKDNSWGVVTIAVEDFTRNPITMGSTKLKAYDAQSLSSSILEFMVWVMASITVPEFVSPTPESQHVYTVYAGSVLSIPLAAKTDAKTPFSTQVVKFNIVSLPHHTFTLPTPVPDPQRTSERVVTSSLTWRTSDNDKGDFIIQIVAVDSDGFESQDRNYKIHVRDFHQDRDRLTDANPYFPFFPTPGSIRCLVNATCSVPIFARPGIQSHFISSIGILTDRTDIAVSDSGTVDYVLYRGTHVYRTDLRFTADHLGNKSVCFRASDNYGLHGDKCTDVALYPPNPCDSKPCNTGMCIPDGINFSCLCGPTNIGRTCDQWLDPCLSHPCQNNGDCKSRTGMQIAFCMCKPGFSGQHCQFNIDECVSSPCKNGGVCVDEVFEYHCLCRHGFTGQNCTDVIQNDPCTAKYCDPSSQCVVPQGSSTAECKCPLGRGDPNCSTGIKTTPLIQTSGNLSTPHSVAPTLQPGSQITCSVGMTCTIPVYLDPATTSGPQPIVVRGITSPGLMTSVGSTTTATVMAVVGALTSNITVTPQEAGSHSACFEIKNSSGVSTEQICYIINTPDPNTVGTQTPPNVNKFQRFTEQTPPDGSVINCVTSQPCHLLTHTTKSQTGTCDASQKTVPASAGALGFETSLDTTTNTCVTDILLEPMSLPTAQVCLVVGIGGDKRCYTVNTVNDMNGNPCSSDPCHGHGQCVATMGTPGYSCVCQVPYSGLQCMQVDDCSSDRCENQGVCVSAGSGFACQCQSGFGPPNSNCRHESTECSAKNCENGAICVMQKSTAVCHCPLTKDGNRCEMNSTSPHSAGPVKDPSKPHAVSPTLGHGSTIRCEVGSTCHVPLYVTGDPGQPPHITTGVITPHITTDVTSPVPVTLMPDMMTSSLIVKPTKAGQHHVCVSIKDAASSNEETICYNINSTASFPQGPATIPNSDANQPAFTAGTPNSGTMITCTKGTTCHILAQTEKSSSGQCSDVRTQSVGVYIFPPTELDSTTCGTDVLIDPDNLGSNDACISVGLTGEKRCFPVSTIGPGNDPCASSHCENGGVCIPNSSAAQTYICACPVPYSSPTCSTRDTCSSRRCRYQAVCTDIPGGGFSCSCQPGYEGQDCHLVPQACQGKQCENGALCVERETGKGVCLCPLGKEGLTCSDDITDLPVNPNTDPTKPHVVVPSLGNGLVISCQLNEPCGVPIIMTGTNPHINTGLVSPGLTTHLTPPTASAVPGDTMTSHLTLTANLPGTQHVCVDVGDGSATSDTVCYVVEVATSIAPTVPPAGGRFSTGMPAVGSIVICRHDTPCHMLAITKPTSSGTCPGVQSHTVAVYSFSTTKLDSGNCSTDVLIDSTIQGAQACIRVGNGGEERCYTVNLVNSTDDPCGNNADCQNGGHCIPAWGNTYKCICPSNYTGDDCSTAQEPCSLLTCENGGQCVYKDGRPVCMCPLGKSGPFCHSEEPDVPVNKNTNKAEPHAVLPTPENGYEIHCDVSDTCFIPVYIHTNSGLPAEVTAGLHTSGISSAVVGTPLPTPVLPNTLISNLSVTPTLPGLHHVCVDVKQSNGVDSVCYTVNTQGNGQSTNQPPTGGQFTGTTPPHQAHVSCRDVTRCHVIVQTPKPTLPNSCDSITTQSSGTFIFPMPMDSQHCNTDVLLDPQLITSSGACVRVGTNGEERCYTIHDVSQHDPCSGSPCRNGGKCVVVPAPVSHKCLCLPFFSGLQCQTDMTDQTVNTNADKNKPHAVVPTPVNGLQITCDVGSTCIIPVYVAGGGQVTLGPHTPDVQTAVGPSSTTAQLPNTAVSPLKVTPRDVGPHHVCVDIRDSTGLVDSLCYTVVGKSPTTTPVQPPGGGAFKEGTPPSNADIKCLPGVACQLIVHTDKPPSQPCTPVQTSNAGLFTYPPVTSWLDGSTCDTVVTFDPSTIGTGPVCIMAAASTGSPGEERCYTITPITGDVCSTSPCRSGWGCLLDPTRSGFRCICPYMPGHSCDQLATVAVTADETTQISQQTSAGNSNTQTSNPGANVNIQTASTGGNANTHTSYTGGKSNTYPSNYGGNSNTQTSNTGGNFNTQPSNTNIGGSTGGGRGTSETRPNLPGQECAARNEAFKKAVKERRVRCTCFNPHTNRTYTVVKPKVSNGRLARTAGIGAGMSIGAIGLTALIIFLVSKLKKWLSKAGTAAAASSSVSLSKGKGFCRPPVEQFQGTGSQWHGAG